MYGVPSVCKEREREMLHNKGQVSSLHVPSNSRPLNMDLCWNEHLEQATFQDCLALSTFSAHITETSYNLNCWRGFQHWPYRKKSPCKFPASFLGETINTRIRLEHISKLQHWSSAEPSCILRVLALRIRTQERTPDKGKDSKNQPLPQREKGKIRRLLCYSDRHKLLEPYDQCHALFWVRYCASLPGLQAALEPAICEALRQKGTLPSRPAAPRMTDCESVTTPLCTESH